MADTIDCAVIGAGVIGLAVARALALKGREVVVVEAAETIGTGASSRNSEVIHAGIYYPTESLKARLCVKGRQLLYAYCAAHGIEHRRCGKLIVATEDSQIPALEDLRARARANGVVDLEWLDRDGISALEPALDAVAALLSPSSGIVDSHALMLALQGDAEAAGAVIAFLSPVTGGRIAGGNGEACVVIEVGGAEPATLACRTLVNCAGLGAQAVSASIEGVPAATIPRRYLAKGNYFYLSARAPFERLIYPLPMPASLGLHYTLDLSGQGRFGPDVEWVDDIDYAVDPGRDRRRSRCRPPIPHRGRTALVRSDPGCSAGPGWRAWAGGRSGARTGPWRTDRNSFPWPGSAGGWSPPAPLRWRRSRPGRPGRRS